MAIRLVVFDLDDTLFREADFARSGFVAVAADLRGRLDLRADLAGWMTSRYRRGLRANMFDALGDHFHLALSPRELARLVKLYRDHLPAIRPCRGVPSLLTALGRRGLKIALLSDGYLPCQRNKFQALGLERYFDKVVFTEELGRRAWKPSPAGFELLQQHFGLSGPQCVYVGDNPAKDFIAPNRLGWRTIRWRRPGCLHYDVRTLGAGRVPWAAKSRRDEATTHAIEQRGCSAALRKPRHPINPSDPATRPWRVVRTAPQLLRVIGALDR